MKEIGQKNALRAIPGKYDRMRGYIFWLHLLEIHVCVCCFWAGPRNMRWWPEWRPLLTQPHYWWKSTAGDNLTSCSDTPLTPLIWFHINLVENLCRIGLRIVSLETTRRANWKEFVGIGRQCAFPEIWLETLSSFKFSLETFGSLWLLSITHHPQYENFRQHCFFYQLNFLSLLARLAGQRTLIGTGQRLVTGPFVQRGVVQSLARPGN